MLTLTVIQMKLITLSQPNDDAIRAVKLLTGKMVDVVLEGQQGVSNDEVGEQNINLDEKKNLKKQNQLKKILLLNQTKI